MCASILRQADLRPAIFGENIGTLELRLLRPERAEGGAPSIQLAGIDHLIVDGNEPLQPPLASKISNFRRELSLRTTHSRLLRI